MCLVSFLGSAQPDWFSSPVSRTEEMASSLDELGRLAIVASKMRLQLGLGFGGVQLGLSFRGDAFPPLKLMYSAFFQARP